MHHIHGAIHQHAQFEVSLVSLTQPGPSYTVLVTNEATRTYFCGTKWAELITDYEMEAGDRCTLILDLDGTTYFHFVDPNDSDDE